MIDKDQAWILNDISDDHYGLWEVDWAMNSIGFDLSRDIRIKLITSLIEAGMVEVRFGELGEELVPLSKSEAINKVSNVDNWRARAAADQAVVSLTTSELGDNYLNSGAL